ncbi:phage late control D family protein [Burkholderia cenocepacia]|uniref:phage late control D family protein n=1 Tax=Burkholderia cenocepacia TaxID=95486 RepID=UPI00406C527F
MAGLAALSSDCRIFENRTVPDIVLEVLTPYDFPIKKKLTEIRVLREYCAQYIEIDLTIIFQLMEFDGIYFYFGHPADTC